MGSGRECLSDIRMKVIEAEDRLVIEQNNLYKLNQAYAQKRIKWDEETNELQLVIEDLQEVVKEKQERLASAKQKLEEIFYKPREVELEIERIDKENKKKRREIEEKLSKCTEDIQLEKELKIIQQKRKDVLLSTRWLRDVRSSEGLNFHDGDCNGTGKEENMEVWNEIENKLKIFDKTMRDIDATCLNSQKQRLKELQETLAKLEEEYEEMEKKNQELEQKIKELEKENPQPNIN